MKKLIQIGFAGLAVLLMAQTAVVAQERGERGERGGRGQGNFDPEQMRERMMERYQQTLGFNDQEWRAIRPMIEKVMEKQREITPMGRGGMMGFGGPGGPGGPGFAGRGGAQGGGGGGVRGGGADNPELQALRSAIENGTPSEIQSKLKEYREARETKEKELQESRERLRKVLNAKQEAALVVAGILD
jgi:hypothetical protein